MLKHHLVVQRRPAVSRARQSRRSPPEFAVCLRRRRLDKHYVSVAVPRARDAADAHRPVRAGPGIPVVAEPAQSACSLGFSTFGHGFFEWGSLLALT